jgi:DNA-binding transcriptional LysR family regulator
MDVREIGYVVAVADAGGFTAAAGDLFVSQPALSQAVRKVERELGVELFVRAGREVRLTAAGEAFVDRARPLLRDVEGLRGAVDAVAGLRTGRLDLVCLPTLSVEPMVDLVGAFRVAHPGVTVRLAEPEDVADIEARIRTGRSEVAITEAPRSVTSDVVVHVLGEQEIAVVLPPGMRRRTRRVGVAELADVPLIATPVGTSTRRLVDDAFAAAGASPSIAVETGHREAVVPLVLAGAGATFVAPAARRAAAAAGAATATLDPPLVRTVALLHRPPPLSPAAQAFVDLALAHSKLARSR